MRALVLGLLSVLMTQSVFAKNNDPSVRPDLQIETIQDVDFNSSGKSADLSFEIPASAKSFLIQFSADTNAGIYLDMISDPNGHMVAGQPVRKFNYQHKDLVGKHPEREWENPYFIASFTGSATVLVPNNDMTKVIPGTWKVRFSCKSSGNDCRSLKGKADVVIKKSISATPTIPLRIHFPGKAKWSASSAPHSKDFKLFMSVLEQIFQLAGINVEVLSMEDEEDVVFGGVGDGLQHLLKYSKGDAVNIYFAKTTFNWVGSFTIAASYALPGGYMDRATTGVVIRTKTIYSDQELRSENKMDYQSIDSTMSIPKYALSTAHEIAHYLGLFHVCEEGAMMSLSNGMKDPLNSVCDQKNLMFWGLDSFHLTPQQIEVIKRHPLVY